METAAHTAEKLGLAVEACDFMREISWGSVDGEPLYEKGHPRRTADLMVSEGQSIALPDWAEQPPFCRNTVTQKAKPVADGIDGWLADFGYRREGMYYRGDHLRLLTGHAYNKKDHPTAQRLSGGFLGYVTIKARHF